MTTQVRMIDVSSYNHPNDEPIDWERVKRAGVGAVMIKCSEGASYVNPWRERDGADAWAAGLLVGYYHFAHPGGREPRVEGEYALTAIDALPRNLGLALDLEVVEAQSWPYLKAWALEFLGYVDQVVTHTPIYLDDHFLANLPGAPFGHRLWNPRATRPRREVWAWQEATPATVPGIAAPTDVGWLHPVE